jgi:cell division septum initiation protein DivIVA
MDLTSYQAEAVTFREARRGFHQGDVAQFQQRVVRALRSYERELHDVQRRLAMLENERARTGAAGDEAQRAFLAGVDAKNSIIDRAERDAAELLAETRRRAESERARLDAEAEEARAGLIGELERLRGEAAVLEAEMDALRSGLAAGPADLDAARHDADEVRRAATAAAAATLEAAGSEAEMILKGARDEARRRLETAAEIRADAERAAAVAHVAVATADADRVGRERAAYARIQDLRVATAAAEDGFRRAVDDALARLGLVRRGLDEASADLAAPPERAASSEGETGVTVDLRSDAAPDEPVGFYEKRLAGLRRRLEADGD